MIRRVAFLRVAFSAREPSSSRSHGSTAGRGRSRWRAVLVAAEIAMATVLLVSSVLMVRGFRALARGGAQVRPAAMLTMRIAISGEKYQESYQVANFYQIGRASCRERV